MNNEDSDKSAHERSSNLEAETVKRILALPMLAQQFPEEEYNVLASQSAEFTASLTDLSIRDIKDGKIPSGLFSGLRFLTTAIVTEGEGSRIRFERHYVAPHDIRAIMLLGSSVLESIRSGVIVPTTAVYLDMSVVADQGHKYLMLLQKFKELSMEAFPASHFEPNEFPLVSPPLSIDVPVTWIQAVNIAIAGIGETMITQRLSRDRFNQMLQQMNVNPHVKVEAFQEELAPTGLGVRYIPTQNTLDVGDKPIFTQVGDYAVLIGKVKDGLLEISISIPLAFKTEPSFLI